MKTLFSIIAVSLLASLPMKALPSVPADTESVRKPQSVFDRYHQDDAIDIQLETDLQGLIANKKSQDYFPATLTLQDGPTMKSWDVKVRPRGRFRRMKGEFPPLKIKFSKEELFANGLSEDNDYKLVTHFYDAPTGDEAILREYLVYRMYNLLTSHSLRAQLARVTYVDAKSGIRTTRFGILLEDSDQLARRYDVEECDDCYNLPEDHFERGNLPLLALFQYMIGNTDWSLQMIRNVKIMRNANTGSSFVVPYDFDFCGMVNAPYARPNKDYGQVDVKQRVYLGNAWSKAQLSGPMAVFKGKKAELFELIEQFKPLDKKAKKEMLQYLGEFYVQLESHQIPVH